MGTAVLVVLAVLNLAALAALAFLVLRGRSGAVEGRIADASQAQVAALQSATATLARSNAESAATLMAGLHDALEKGRREQAESLRAGVTALEAKFETLRQATDRRLGETVDANLKNFQAVADRLGQLHEATGQIVALSQGVNDLNVLLQTPKGRGAFGEMTLEQMLGDLLGDHTELFEMQYGIEEGERVDAAIFVRPDRSQVLCVDSKFPLANAQPLVDGTAADRAESEKAFGRDVLARAEEIRSKYIRPPKTLDFAFMFVPAESVYYLLLKDRKIHEQLLRMHVVPTSPNSFYAYLRALATAFRGLKIEEKSQELLRTIERIAKDFERFAEDFRVLGDHIGKLSSKYSTAQKDVERFQRDVAQLKLGEAGNGAPALPEGKA